MAVTYMRPELPGAILGLLEDLDWECRKHGYELGANLLLKDTKFGSDVSVVRHCGGTWVQLEGRDLV